MWIFGLDLLGSFAIFVDSFYYGMKMPDWVGIGHKKMVQRCAGLAQIQD